MERVVHNADEAPRWIPTKNSRKKLHLIVLAVGIGLLLASCSDNDQGLNQPVEAAPSTADNLVELAPGVYFFEHEGGVRIKLEYLEFDETSLQAIREQVAATSGLAAQSSDPVVIERGDRWATELAFAEEAMASINSPEGQSVLQALYGSADLTSQGVGCSHTATARPTTAQSGAKASARADCEGVDADTFAKATAEAGGSNSRDTDSGGNYSYASTSKYGASPRRSYAEAESETDWGGYPLGRDTDRNSSCGSGGSSGGR